MEHVNGTWDIFRTLRIQPAECFSGPLKWAHVINYANPNRPLVTSQPEARFDEPQFGSTEINLVLMLRLLTGFEHETNFSLRLRITIGLTEHAQHPSLSIDCEIGEVAET